MIEDLFYFIFEIIFIGIGIIIQSYLIREWKINRNKINIFLIAFLGIFQLVPIIKLLSLFMPKMIFTIGIGLNIFLLLAVITSILQATFILYLKNATFYYSLPVISGFFICAGLAIFNATTAFIVFGLLISIVSFIIMTIEAKKNHNGMLLGLAMFFLIYGFSQMTRNLVSISFFHIISILLLLFGISGAFNNNILVNREEQEQIEGVWISKMTIRGN